MPRAIDHLVLAVPDLAAAAATYRALGFSVGTRNRHPWGTENHVVQLHGAFLELIGLADNFVAPAPYHPAARFAADVEAAVKRGGGFASVALRTEDAGAEAKRLSSLGLGSGRMMHFGRTSEAPDGTRRELSFTLAFVDLPALPEAGFFFCQQRAAGAFLERGGPGPCQWSPVSRRRDALPRHPVRLRGDDRRYLRR